MIHQKQSGNVVYFSYLGSVITNVARFTYKIKSRIIMAKVAFDKQNAVYTRVKKKNSMAAELFHADGQTEMSGKAILRTCLIYGCEFCFSIPGKTPQSLSLRSMMFYPLRCN
jgi:hypothetical protein